MHSQQEVLSISADEDDRTEDIDTQPDEGHQGRSQWTLEFDILRNKKPTVADIFLSFCGREQRKPRLQLQGARTVGQFRFLRASGALSLHFRTKVPAVPEVPRSRGPQVLRSPVCRPTWLTAAMLPAASEPASPGGCRLLECRGIRFPGWVERPGHRGIRVPRWVLRSEALFAGFSSTVNNEGMERVLTYETSDFYYRGLAASDHGHAGNTKAILVMYEDDAEDWAVYLRTLFSQTVEREGILLYCLEGFSLQHLESLSLTSYKCKLLILSSSVLKDLTPRKSEFLEQVLDSPACVVTLLCGLGSAAPLYESLNTSAGRWELSTQQEPQDYISVIQRVLSGVPFSQKLPGTDLHLSHLGFLLVAVQRRHIRRTTGYLNSEDYLEVSVPADQRVNNPGEMRERKQTEASSGPSGSAVSLAMVLPAEVPCENPGEIFIFLKDEVVGETVEAEFTSHAKCIRTRPAPWGKNVWCMKALDFPAGSVTVRVYCDGILTATVEMKYCSPVTPAEGPAKAADPGGVLCWNDVEELDGILTSIFKQEIPYYDFQSLQSEICPQNEYTHINELPTLLHCAAKFGLKNLALHLLQCSGANWASKMKNTSGADPAHIANKYGHEELKQIFEDFSIQEISRNNEQLNDYEEDRISLSAYSPGNDTVSFRTASESPALHQGRTSVPRQSGHVAEATAGRRERQDPGPAEGAGESLEDPYNDLYMFIPGTELEPDGEPPACCRPPLPPPRLACAALQPEKLRSLSQRKTREGQVERSHNWSDSRARRETRDEPKGGEEKKADEGEQEEEDPYTFAETNDSDYDMILSKMSVKRKPGSWSFIINRPPAPAPRPTNVLPKEETVPYIAQVFQQKTARRQSDSDKFHGLPKKPDKARMECPTVSIPRCCLAAGQEELILLQEKVKNGKLSVDEALEKFKHWQMGKSGLEMIQQEKLRQLRDSIIGKRPEEENICDKLTIVHHPSGTTARHENMLYNIPFSNKLPAPLQVEKEFGFCCRKDH
ncbi:B-cell scaffold protein with ankyrin repeats [Erethizon dorsatum]